jgi:hypothetical protein
VREFSSIILASARRKSESILSYGELFQRSNRQNLPKRQVQYLMRTSSKGNTVQSRQAFDVGVAWEFLMVGTGACCVPIFIMEETWKPDMRIFPVIMTG